MHIVFLISILCIISTSLAFNKSNKTLGITKLSSCRAKLDDGRIIDLSTKIL